MRLFPGITLDGIQRITCDERRLFLSLFFFSFFIPFNAVDIVIGSCELFVRNAIDTGDKNFILTFKGFF